MKKNKTVYIPVKIPKMKSKMDVASTALFGEDIENSPYMIIETTLKNDIITEAYLSQIWIPIGFDFLDTSIGCFYPTRIASEDFINNIINSIKTKKFDITWLLIPYYINNDYFPTEDDLALKMVVLGYEDIYKGEKIKLSLASRENN